MDTTRPPKRISLLVLMLLSAHTAAGKTIYVDDSAGGLNNGTSWAHAHVYLQDALGGAALYDRICVAQGTYRPDLGAGQTPGDIEASFELPIDVYVYGGYAGYGAPDPDARSVSEYETILSGVIGTGTNSKHVVVGDWAAVLDGFTITGGKGGEQRSAGGGLYNLRWNLVVRNCTFTGNSADDGGGLYNAGDNVDVINCKFNSNLAGSHGEGLGGGMTNGGNGVTVSNCTFSGNEASHGGGMYNVFADSLAVTNCAFNNSVFRTPRRAGALFGSTGSSSPSGTPGPFERATPRITSSVPESSHSNHGAHGDDPRGYAGGATRRSLTQHTMAAGRQNPLVHRYFRDDHPAVIQLIHLAVKEAGDALVGICGELAGQPNAVPMLLDAGVRLLSVAPPLVPVIKEASPVSKASPLHPTRAPTQRPEPAMLASITLRSRTTASTPNSPNKPR